MTTGVFNRRVPPPMVCMGPLRQRYLSGTPLAALAAKVQSARPRHPTIQVRSVLRYLPALLALLVPLVFLFWLGGRELSRLANRADVILQNEAYVFLRNADRKVQQLLTEKASRRLEDIVDLDNRSLVEAARELCADPWVLDMFLCCWPT